MDSDPASRARRKHTNGWMTVLALGLLALGLLACLYILIGFPAEAQAVGGSTTEPTTTRLPLPSPAVPAPAAAGHRAAAPGPAPSGADLRRPLRTPISLPMSSRLS